jgi:predicted HTH transcriptional regulator
MDFIYGLIIGLIAGLVIGYLSWNKSKTVVTNANKGANLEKVRELIATSDRVTNDQVQQLLGVSDATTERYLNELEKEGIIKQVGAEGKGVYYIKQS